MNSSKFLGDLSKAYKQILFEQDLPPAPPASGPEPGAPPSVPPVAQPPIPPPAPNGGVEGTSDVEKAKPVEGPVGQETEALLVGLLAKSIFIDVEDEEKYQLKNMQANLNDKTAPQVELEVVKRVKTEEYEILDIDESLFELTPPEAHEFVNQLVKSGIIGKEELKSGGGEVYLLNLIITALMRNFDISEKGKVIDILEGLQEKRLKKESRKWEKLLNSQIEKYAKV